MQTLGPQFAVTVADPMLGKSHAEDERASAIVAAARRLFETLGIWQSVAAQAQPILDMVVTDSRLDDAMRPVFLTFAGEIEPGEPFAHMIENRFLIAALEAKARDVGVELRKTAIASFSYPTLEGEGRPPSGGRRGVNAAEGAAHHFEVELADGSTISAGLLVAADGARSSIRERAGIAVHGWNYGQSAIVINVGHERDHEGRAMEHFLPAGPFAILPLKGRRSSIVWTETTAKPSASWRYPTTRSMPSSRQRFKLHLGEITTVGARRVHPLGFFVARSFIAERLALIGDAAHRHSSDCRTGAQYGAQGRRRARRGDCRCRAARPRSGRRDVLERYQRWRRFDTMTMGFATDGLNRLFSNRSAALRLVRDVGLGLVDRVPQLKRCLSAKQQAWSAKYRNCCAAELIIIGVS